MDRIASQVLIHIYYILYTIYTTLILHLEDRQLLRMRGSKVVAACIFNQLHVFFFVYNQNL